MKELLILGSGGCAREVVQLVEDINAARSEWRIIGYLDDDPNRQGSTVNGYPVVGPTSSVAQYPDIHIVIAIGSPMVRRAVHLRCYREHGHSPLATLVHPDARVGRRVTLGAGSIVCCGSIITTNISVGDHTIINLGCTISHDVEIGPYVTLAPGVRVSGAVRIGSGTDIGINAAITPGVAIGEWSVLGAGTVVVRDIPDNVTVVGVPGKVIRTRPPGWHLPQSLQ